MTTRRRCLVVLAIACVAAGAWRFGTPSEFGRERSLPTYPPDPCVPTPGPYAVAAPVRTRGFARFPAEFDLALGYDARRRHRYADAVRAYTAALRAGGLDLMTDDVVRRPLSVVEDLDGDDAAAHRLWRSLIDTAPPRDDPMATAIDAHDDSGALRDEPADARNDQRLDLSEADVIARTGLADARKGGYARAAAQFRRASRCDTFLQLPHLLLALTARLLGDDATAHDESLAVLEDESGPSSVDIHVLSSEDLDAMRILLAEPSRASNAGSRSRRERPRSTGR